MKDLKAKFKRLAVGRRDQKLPDQKPPDQKLPDQKPPDQKPPDQKLPDLESASNEGNDQRVAEAKQFIEDKRRGSLVFTIRGPSLFSPRVSAHVHRYGDESGPDLIHSVDAPDRGFVKAKHPSHEQYRISKKFIERETTDELDQEDHILLDAEASPVYENVNPGTATVEGFGLDYWQAVIIRGRSQPAPDVARMPELGDMATAGPLFRRLGELRTIDSHSYTNQDDELADLRDILGTDEMYTAAATHAIDHEERILNILYGLLNQDDRFLDLSTVIVFSEAAAGFNEDMSEGAWNFYIQMMVAKELALRLQSYTCTKSVRGFSVPVLAALLLSDLWLQNTTIELVESFTLVPRIIKAKEVGVTPEERETADELIRQGDKILEDGDLLAAGELYSKAILIDLTNFEYIRKRAEIMMTLGHYRSVAREAQVMKLLDPTRAIAESMQGHALMGYKNYARARKMFERAAQLAESEAEKADMLAERDKAEAAYEAETWAIEQETDAEKKRTLVRARQEMAWDAVGKSIWIKPTKYERQLEGLVLFAEQIQWPYLDEVRDGFDKAYREWLYNNEPMEYFLQDWWFALTLPGSGFAQTIMTALIYSSPSVKQLREALSTESGLVLPKCTYWRVRTVLARVLGCLPGVVSVNGWVGPCPAVQVINETAPQHCLVTTWYFNPNSLVPAESEDETDGLIFTRDPMLAANEITDSSQWIALRPPAQEDGTLQLTSIQLTRWKLLDPNSPRGVWLYNAELTFRHEGGFDFVFRMQHNPVFVTLPPCNLGERSTHEAHPRMWYKYKRTEVSAKELYQSDPYLCPPDMVLVVNATAEGAEVVARAWCAKYGRNAVIRRSGGPCYACSVVAASGYGLRVGILIWVS